MALNKARHDLQAAVERRLLAVSKQAMSNVAVAIENGDLKASIIVLKGLGLLGGVAPTVGSDDPSELAADVEAGVRRAKVLRTMLRRNPEL